MSATLDIELLEETESTNARALRAADEGAVAGTVVVADRQTAGRGRREDGDRRRWFSPAGKNLYLSVVLRPDVPTGRASAMTLAAGAELVALLREKTGVDVQLKWPNDLYVGDRKLGGILTEANTGPGGLKAVVVGVGINVNVETAAFPEALRPIATSLQLETGSRCDRLSLALEVPRAIIEAGGRYETEGLEAWAESLQRWNYLEGRRVLVGDDGDRRPGIAGAIGTEGGLVVEFDDGERREIRSGEIEIVDRPAGG